MERARRGEDAEADLRAERRSAREHVNQAQREEERQALEEVPVRPLDPGDLGVLGALDELRFLVRDADVLGVEEGLVLGASRRGVRAEHEHLQREDDRADCVEPEPGIGQQRRHDEHLAGAAIIAAPHRTAYPGARARCKDLVNLGSPGAAEIVSPRTFSHRRRDAAA